MNINIISSSKRKRHQRIVNKYVREINKKIENDELWRGRFYCKQINSQFWQFKDNSGSVLSVHLRFYDKKTGLTKDYYTTSISLNLWEGAYLYLEMNEFITKYCSVWKREMPVHIKIERE